MRDTIIRRLCLWLALVGAGAGGVAMAAQSVSAPPSVIPPRYGVFEAALVPLGSADVGETAALHAAIAAYRKAGDPAHTDALDRFLQRYPHTVWRVGLMTNEGLAYAHAGEFSRALDRLRSAWQAGRAAPAGAPKALADRALGALLNLHTALGHAERVEALLAEAEGRVLSGSVEVARTTAREALWRMRHEPDRTFLCGVLALKVLLTLEGDTAGLARLDGVASSPGGMSLARLQALAARAGLAATPVFRSAGQPLPVPAIVHWKVGHYATIVAKAHGRVHVKDAAMGREFWMSPAAVRRESSGYFLVPAALHGPWRTVAAREAHRIVGAGITSGNDPDATSSDDPDICGCGQGGSKGMARYSVKAMLVSLSLHDTPVSYTPPLGPAMAFTLVYSQREAHQPAVFTYFNFGQKWTSNWLSYVEDDPAHPGDSVRVSLRGGGSRSYHGYDSASGAFAPERRTGAQLVEVSTSPVVYERRLPDGSKAVYASPDGSRYYPRRIFLTRVVDPAGHKQRVEYRHNAPGLPFSVSPVPSGISTFNSYMNSRNTFYWDPATMAKAPGDYTQALVYHWLHEEGPDHPGLTAGVVESIKRPLEHRVWFNYPDQPWAGGTGGFDQPSVVARVLDDGSTQRRRYRYNRFGRLTQAIDPVGRELDYTYAPNGIDLIQVARKTASGADVLAQITYNGHHQPLTYTDAAGQTTRYAYNGAGQLAQTTGPLGHATEYQYDARGYLVAVIDANGQPAHRYAYDGYGRVASVTDSEGHTVRYAYDALNRLTGITYPDGSERTVTWDKLDVVATTDREGRTTTYAYDRVRDLLSRTDPMGQVIRYGYDPSGRLQRLTDPNGHTTTWGRDIEGRITARTYADGSKVSYAYDAAGRVQSKADALGQVTEYRYTGADQLAAIRYLNAGHATPAVTFTYDADYPRLASRDDGQGTTTYHYYPAGAPGAGRLQTIQGANPHDRIEYTYDALGRLSARTVDGVEQTYAYDALGHLTGEHNALGELAYDYLGETGQPTSWRVAGVPYQVTYQYEDNRGDRRLKAILNETIVNGRSQPVADYTYTTSPAGLILSRSESGGGKWGWHRGHHAGWTQAPHRGVVAWLQGLFDETGPGWSAGASHERHGHVGHNPDRDHRRHGRVHHYGWAHHRGDGDSHSVLTQYTYDAALRLVGVQGGDTESYAYDAAGNLTARTVDDTTTILSVNLLNQLTSGGEHAYTYDANGGLLDDGKHTYVWDGADRLIEIHDQTSGHISRFQYDGLSRRVSATETDADGTSVSTHLLWCGRRPCERRAADDTVLARYYRQGEVHQDQTLYYAQDQVGSVVALVNSSGDVVGHLSYDAYGHITHSSGTLPDFRYAGLFYHRASGLELATYRAYAPQTGHWLSRDPIREAGGPNLYAYVNGNPLSFNDPFGLFRFGRRPLSGAYIAIPIGSTNVGVFHENGFYDNGNNIGYFPDGIRPDAASQFKNYSFFGPYYNDSIIQKAAESLRQSGHWRQDDPNEPWYSNSDPNDYDTLLHNCQDFADALRHEYKKLGAKTCPDPFVGGVCKSSQ